MPSSALGTMVRIVLRRRSSAAHLSPFTVARYSSIVVGFRHGLRSLPPEAPASRPAGRGRAREDEQVGDQVDRQDRRAEQELDAAREARRVEDGNEVVLDESARVASRASLRALPVLQRGQRADPTGPFHEDAPQRGREVNPDRSRPAQDQERPGDDEEDEAEVEDEHGVREEAIQHAPMLQERAHICGLEVTPADSVHVRSDSPAAPLYSSYILSRGTRPPVARRLARPQNRIAPRSPGRRHPRIGRHYSGITCCTHRGSWPSHSGWIVVASKIDVVLNSSNLPLVAALAVFCSNAFFSTSLRGRKVRAAVNACSRISMLSMPVMTTDVGRLRA